MCSREHISYLTASEYRPSILRTLSASRCCPRDLVDQCGGSRTTIHRVLNGLHERGWIQKFDGSYTTTPFGDSIIEQYERLCSRVETANEYGEWYTAIGHPDHELPTELFDSATITTAAENAPHRPLERLTTRMSSFNSPQILVRSPVVSSFLGNAIERAVMVDGSVELVVPQSVLDQHTDRINDQLSQRDVTFYAARTSISFGIIRLEDTVFITAYDDTRRLSACLETATETAREWSLNVFEETTDETMQCW